MLVGTEWLVDAEGCDPAILRDGARMRALFDRIIAELGLRLVGEVKWHTFPGEGGITGLALLTESHLACHTYPEHGAATFNLYSCRALPAWPWEARLADALGAARVAVRAQARGSQP
jgi:S-adenosylmethionine decarboxylase